MGRATEFTDYMNREPGSFPDGYKDSLAYISIDDHLKKLRRRHLSQSKKQAASNQLSLFTKHKTEMTTELKLTAGEANILLAILQKTQDSELGHVYNTAKKTAKRAVLTVTPDQAMKLRETFQSYIDQEEDLILYHEGREYPHSFAEYAPYAIKALKKISKLKFIVSTSHTGTVVF